MGAVVGSYMGLLPKHATRGRRRLGLVERRGRGGAAARLSLESRNSWTRKGRRGLELEGMGMRDAACFGEEARGPELEGMGMGDAAGFGEEAQILGLQEMEGMHSPILQAMMPMDFPGTLPPPGPSEHAGLWPYVLPW